MTTEENTLAVKTPMLEKLLDDLQEFIQQILSNYRLFVKQDGWQDQPQMRDAEVSQMIMPDPDEEHERVPYVLLQLINGSDKKRNDGTMESRVEVRIVIVLYNQDKPAGRLQVLRVVQKIRYELWRAGEIGKMFTLEGLEYLIYPDDTNWYHMGELSTEWAVPAVERDLTAILAKIHR